MLAARVASIHATAHASHRASRLGFASPRSQPWIWCSAGDGATKPGERRRSRGAGLAQPAFRGDRLLAARNAVGLSREDLTLQLSLSSPIRIKLWEEGVERPRPGFVPPLAVAVGVNPLHLLDVDPADPPLAALRIAAGLATKQMARPGMSVMSYQRIEGGRPGVDASDAVVAAIADALRLDARTVYAGIQRARSDVLRTHADIE